MGKVFALLTVIVLGIILADSLIHPAGVKALGGTANQAWGTTTKALLGKA